MNIQIRKYYYGDIPEENPGATNESQQASYTPLGVGGISGGVGVSVGASGNVGDWPLWEVFIRSKQGLDHKHVGSLHAVDAAMAIENARDVYTRRMEGVSIWVVESKHIHTTSADEATSLYEPAEDKIYRHPTFYKLPDEVDHM
jgi:ring-1,2-phenylacetyl-CoA epoxidase subunit PaaB